MSRQHAFPESRSPPSNRFPDSPVSERRPSDLAIGQRSPEIRTQLDVTSRLPGILLRKLPRSAGHDSLITMLLFATDLQAVAFIDSTPEDAGFATAIAQFRTHDSAREAQERLNNKPNATGDANMIVEAFLQVLANSALGRRLTMRRNILESILPRQTAHGLNGHRNFEDGVDHLFSPRSPVSNRLTERPQNSSKAFINDGDDETGELLKNPLAFAQDQQRTNDTLVQFSSMSLVPYNNPPSNMLALAHSGNPSRNGPYRPTSRDVSYPPANPNDQHPPCNTLYVGNLPTHTTEAELKDEFCGLRGYKKMSYRVKPNGPLCFIEFEDIGCAVLALNAKYGKMLSGSTKDGMRLSFSKNQLGHRSSQNAVPAHMQIYGNGVTPPPGLLQSALPPPGFVDRGYSPDMNGYGGYFEGYPASYGQMQMQIQMPPGRSLVPYGHFPGYRQNPYGHR